MSISIRPASDADALAISICVETAFMRPIVPRMVEEMRAKGRVAAEFVAEVDGVVLGYLALIKMVKPVGWTVLWPLAVSPVNQGKGYGAALITAAKDTARAQKIPAVLVTSQRDYFARNQFSINAGRNLTGPIPAERIGMYAVQGGIADAAFELEFPETFDQTPS